METLDLTDLTVLLGLVRRAKANAERRHQRRQHLHSGGVGGDPTRTKVNKLGRLLAKLEALQSLACTPGPGLSCLEGRPGEGVLVGKSHGAGGATVTGTLAAGPGRGGSCC